MMPLPFRVVALRLVSKSEILLCRRRRNRLEIMWNGCAWVTYFICRATVLERNGAAEAKLERK